MRRMQVCVTALMEQAKKYNLNAELIIVEWNPPPERPPLSDALTWPEKSGPCRVRIIPVPHELHKRLQYSDKLPLFQMIAKNVGVRRARGHFVLATNIDLLFSEELVRFLASERLKSQFMYRIDRYDVRSGVPLDATIEDRLNYCRNNVIRVNRRDGTFSKDDLRWIRFKKIYRGFKQFTGYLLLFMPQWSLERFLLDVKTVPMRMFKGLSKILSSFRSSVNRVLSLARAQMPRMFRLLMKNPLKSIVALVPACLRVLPRIARAFLHFMRSLLTPFSIMSKTVRIFFVRRAILLNNGLENLRRLIRPPYPRLHTNACGDFTLMSREHWHTLRGYPELEMYSFNLDSVLCQMAYQIGVREKMLKNPMRIYHVEHSSGWTPEGDAQMRERLKTRGIPMLEFAEYRSWAIQMHKQKRPINPNNEEWGLATEHLLETEIG